MPASLELPFRVRHYECDAYGHLNNTTYLHYLEEVEIEAGIAADCRPHHVDIRYLAPVSFGDTVVVTASDGPQRLRAYGFSRDGEPVATATAIWLPQDDPGDGIDPVPAPPPPPAAVFTRSRRVEWQDVTASAAVSVAGLAGMAEDCGLALCASYGWPLARCTEDGFAMVVRRHEIGYRHAAGLGDELTIATWASDRSRASAVRHYVMTCHGTTVARFRSHYVWVDVGTLRPLRIPTTFLADFAENFARSSAARS